MATNTFSYSLSAITAPAPKVWKVGDEFHTSDVVILDAFPEDTVLIHVEKGTSHIVGSRVKGTGNFKGSNYIPLSRYRVAWIPPKKAEADPLGDLAVKLMQVKNPTYSPADAGWVRGDASWRRLAEYVEKNFIPSGQQIIVDEDGDPWYKLADGTYALDRGAKSGRDRAYLKDIYGTITDIAVR